MAFSLKIMLNIKKNMIKNKESLDCRNPISLKWRTASHVSLINGK